MMKRLNQIIFLNNFILSITSNVDCISLQFTSARSHLSMKVLFFLLFFCDNIKPYFNQGMDVINNVNFE